MRPLHAVEPPDLPLGGGVPKLIHQTHGRGPLNQDIAENISRIRHLNPDYEHRLYDDAAVETFISESYSPKILAYYQAIDPRYGAARADLFRYLLMYKIGGVYLDIKSTTISPLKDRIRDSDVYVLSRWANTVGAEYDGYGLHPELADVSGGEFQQWHIICSSGHPFLRAVLTSAFARIRNYRPWRDGVGRHGTLRLTGPITYTRAIAPLLAQARHRIVPTESSLGLKYTIYDHHLEHTRLTKSHYHWNRSAIVRRGGLLGARFKADELARRVRESRKLSWLRGEGGR